MWLIDTVNHRLVEVDGPKAERYAILSHTWVRGEEVSFQDMQSPAVAEQKPGWAKIIQTCRLAQEQDPPIHYAWVDTCCIDKTSSAELSEAINSMFQWYQLSAVCFVYLADFNASGPVREHQLRFCRWFGRGWTLQELIAPTSIEFYDSSWRCFADKASLSETLSSITRIDLEVLADSGQLPFVPVARRMSWAATRETTRIEDLAYCLFGIFDVYLPLIYGEGSRSFIRLQEAIAQNNPDLSLFAWTSPADTQPYRGIFALRPREFEKCSTIKNTVSPMDPPLGYSLGNNGIQIQAGLHLALSREGEHDYLMDLKCVDLESQQSDGAHGSVFIRLVKSSRGYARHCFTRPIVVSRTGLRDPEQTSISIPKFLDAVTLGALRASARGRLFITIVNETLPQASATSHAPRHLWNPHGAYFITENYDGFTASLLLSWRRFRQMIDIGIGQESCPRETEPRRPVSPPSFISAQSSTAISPWVRLRIAGGTDETLDPSRAVQCLFQKSTGGDPDVWLTVSARTRGARNSAQEAYEVLIRVTAGSRPSIQSRRLSSSDPT